MHNIHIPEANLNLYLPADFSECEQQQYMDMCELIFRFHNQEIDYLEFRSHAVYKLLGSDIIQNDTLPEINKPLWTGQMGYHIRTITVINIISNVIPIINITGFVLNFKVKFTRSKLRSTKYKSE